MGEEPMREEQNPATPQTDHSLDTHTTDLAVSSWCRQRMDATPQSTTMTTTICQEKYLAPPEDVINAAATSAPQVRGATQGLHTQNIRVEWQPGGGIDLWPCIQYLYYIRCQSSCRGNAAAHR